MVWCREAGAWRDGASDRFIPEEEAPGFYEMQAGSQGRPTVSSPRINVTNGSGIKDNGKKFVVDVPRAEWSVSDDGVEEGANGARDRVVDGT